MALLRGINVGGRNLIGMPALAEWFRGAGYEGVQTYLQSGNVIFTVQPATGPELEDALERMLLRRFEVSITVIVRSRDELAATIASAPRAHGAGHLRSEVFFLKHPLTAEAVWAQLPDLREGVDSVAPGPGALYFSRVAAQASRTRITRLMSMPIFQQMTFGAGARPPGYSRCSTGADLRQPSDSARSASATSVIPVEGDHVKDMAGLGGWRVGAVG